ncbi:DotU family type IV/VI secretion system protein [Caballeronia sp. GAWG1-1]|uniref:DotU family type IV/VI secretion system protein n=1 Tax=Caballeronia sp. GAWG1-1 TaxID=2921742 RepID=UPI0020293453
MHLTDTLIPVIALVRQTIDTAAAPAFLRPSTAAPAVPRPLPAAPRPVASQPASAGGSPFAPQPIGEMAANGNASANANANAVANAIAIADAPPAPAPLPSLAPRASVSNASSGTPAEDAARARALAEAIDEAIDQARHEARIHNFVPSDFDNALFAVLAWADEVLISSEWAGAPHWQRHLMQRRHFNTTTAGVSFYARLDDLRDDQADVREVFALCLALGFKGRYAQERSSRQLDERRRVTLQKVLDEGGVPAATGAVLFPQAYVSEESARAAQTGVEPAARRVRWRLRRQTLIGFGLPVVVLAVLYGTYHLIIVQMVNALLPLIQ